jgi:predicted aminopeptidase
VRGAAFVKLLGAARAQLARLYEAGGDMSVMGMRKRQILDALGDEIHAFEKREGVTYPLYDQWIAHGLNNAHLASVATYYDCVPGFEQLLAQEDNDLPRFYAAARELSRLPRAERHARLCAGPAGAAAEVPD